MIDCFDPNVQDKARKVHLEKGINIYWKPETDELDPITTEMIDPVDDETEEKRETALKLTDNIMLEYTALVASVAPSSSSSSISAPSSSSSLSSSLIVSDDAAIARALADESGEDSDEYNNNSDDDYD